MSSFAPNSKTASRAALPVARTNGRLPPRRGVDRPVFSSTPTKAPSLVSPGVSVPKPVETTKAPKERDKKPTAPATSNVLSNPTKPHRYVVKLAHMTEQRMHYLSAWIQDLGMEVKILPALTNDHWEAAAWRVCASRCALRFCSGVVIDWYGSARTLALARDLDITLKVRGPKLTAHDLRDESRLPLLPGEAFMATILCVDVYLMPELELYELMKANHCDTAYLVVLDAHHGGGSAHGVSMQIDNGMCTTIAGCVRYAHPWDPWWINPTLGSSLHLRSVGCYAVYSYIPEHLAVSDHVFSLSQIETMPYLRDSVLKYASIWNLLSNPKTVRYWKPILLSQFRSFVNPQPFIVSSLLSEVSTTLMKDSNFVEYIKAFPDEREMLVHGSLVAILESKLAAAPLLDGIVQSTKVAHSTLAALVDCLNPRSMFVTPLLSIALSFNLPAIRFSRSMESEVDPFTLFCRTVQEGPPAFTPWLEYLRHHTTPDKPFIPLNEPAFTPALNSQITPADYYENTPRLWDVPPVPCRSGVYWLMAFTFGLPKPASGVTNLRACVAMRLYKPPPFKWNNGELAHCFSSCENYTNAQIVQQHWDKDSIMDPAERELDTRIKANRWKQVWKTLTNGGGSLEPRINTASVKSDETIPLKVINGRYTMVPRVIIGVDPVLNHCLQALLECEKTWWMDLTTKDGLPVPFWATVGKDRMRVAAHIVLHHSDESVGTAAKMLYEYLYHDEIDVGLLVLGDDTVVFLRDEKGAIWHADTDYTMYDQSQRIEIQLHLKRFLKQIKMPSELIDLWYKVITQGKIKINIPRSETLTLPLDVMQLTGITLTSMHNSLLAVMAGIGAARFRTPEGYIKAISDMGLGLKIEARDPVLHLPSFLKGYCILSLGLWVPSPIAVFKMAKLIRHPSSITNEKNWLKAWQRVAASLASNWKGLPWNFPILGAAVNALERFASSESADLAVTSEEQRYKLHVTHSFTHDEAYEVRSCVLEQLELDFGLTRLEVEGMEKALRLAVLPCVVYHEGFSKLFTGYYPDM